MSYCRFENTLRDLQDCNEHIFDELSGSEDKAREALVRLCYEIVQSFESEVEDLDD
jgi:hypothetical protein